MKIFVNARFLTQTISGVQRYGIECSRQIKKNYPDTIFIAPRNIFNKAVADELDVKVVGMNKGHIWEQIDLPLFLTKHQSPPLLNLANTAPLFYKNNYITLHDLAFHYHPEWNSKPFATWYNFLIPRIAHKAKHIFTVSNTVKQEIIDSYNTPLSKITVTYNGISQSMLEADPSGQLNKQKIILSVGTFNIRKNHQNLIKGFLQSQAKHTHQLVIIGNKNKVFSETGIDESSLEQNNIKVYAHLSEQELIQMYQQAEIVASLSMYEGFGIPLLEGLFNSCKIVCSDIPVYRELYNKYATFCDPYNIDSISNALDEAVIKKGAMAILQATEEDALFERYNYTLAAKQITDIIKANNPV